MDSKQMTVVEHLKKAFEGEEKMSKELIRYEVNKLKVSELIDLGTKLGYKSLKGKRKGYLRELIYEKIDSLSEDEEIGEKPWEQVPVDKRFIRKEGKEGDVIQIWEAEASDNKDAD